MGLGKKDLSIGNMMMRLRITKMNQKEIKILKDISTLSLMQILGSTKLNKQFNRTKTNLNTSLTRPKKRYSVQKRMMKNLRRAKTLRKPRKIGPKILKNPGS